MGFLTPTRSKLGTFMRSPLGVRYRLPLAFPAWQSGRIYREESVIEVYDENVVLQYDCPSLRGAMYPWMYDYWNSNDWAGLSGAILRTTMEYQYNYTPWNDPPNRANAKYLLYRSIVWGEVPESWEGRKIIGVEMGAVTDSKGDGARIEVANFGASNNLDSYPTGHGFDVVAEPDRKRYLLDNALVIGHEYWPEPPEIRVYIHFPKPFPGVYEPHCADGEPYQNVWDIHNVQINFNDAALIFE